MSDDSVPQHVREFAAHVGLAFSFGFNTAEIAELASSEERVFTEAEIVSLLEISKQLTEGKLP
jgi:hypothetical protein